MLSGSLNNTGLALEECLPLQQMIAAAAAMVKGLSANGSKVQNPSPRIHLSVVR